MQSKLADFAAKPETDIDFSDIPEMKAEDWKDAGRGRFFRPIMKQILVKIFILIIAVLPAGCHFKFTTPLLWSHSSSAAFDALIGIWIVDIIAIIWAILYIRGLK